MSLPFGRRAAWHTKFRRSPLSARTDIETGETYDSRDEMERGRQLRTQQDMGLIRKLRRQVRYPIVHGALGALKIRNEAQPNGRSVSYKADFVYETEVPPHSGNWAEIIEERKTGWDDSRSRLLRAVFEWVYGRKVLVTGGRNKAKRKPSRTLPGRSLPID
jgi:hypothetical protein